MRNSGGAFIGVGLTRAYGGPRYAHSRACVNFA
jgi:hypothetical protein